MTSIQQDELNGNSSLRKKKYSSSSLIEHNSEKHLSDNESDASTETQQTDSTKTQNKDNGDEYSPAQLYKYECYQSQEPRKRKQFQKTLPPSEQKVKNLTDGTNYNLMNIILWICFILLCVIVYFVWLQATASQDSNLTNYEKFKLSLANMAKDFPSQPQVTWRTLEAALFAIHRFKRQPSIILMASHKSVALQCIHKRILASLKILFDENPDHEYINGREISKMSTDDASKKIYHALNDGFNNDKKIAIVDYFDEIPADVVGIFFNFCDHENAPFKDVIIMLIVRQEIHYDDADNEENVDKVVSDFLLKIWGKDLKLDISTALLSRIANRVILVKPENVALLDNAC